MKRNTILIFLGLLATTGYGQVREEIQNIKVSTTKAVFLGKTERVEHLAKADPVPFGKSSTYKQSKELPPNFKGRGKSKVTKPELEHQGVDPLWQKKVALRKAAPLTTKVNVEGLTSGSPNDPTGSVGPDYYLQAINATRIGVYDKNDGTLVTQFTGNSLWAPIGESSRGDPIIVYDHEYKQWIITEFANPANLLVAVSETSDPLGSYYVYSFSTPFFPDYPKYGIWGSYFVVTTNEVETSEIEQYFFDRSALMTGQDIVTIQRVAVPGNTSTEAGFYVITPAHWNGDLAPVDDKPVTMKINDSSWGEVQNDVVEVFTFDVDLATPSNTTVTKTSIVTTPFDSYPCDTETGGFACLAQGGESNGLDAIPEVIMNIPNYRNFGTHESIVLNFITDVSDGGNLSGIRWMELRRTSGADWSVYQEGTFAPDDGLHRYMGSIAMDVDGNIGLAYVASSSTEPTGLRFTGRLAEDPPGQMTFDEAVAVSGTNGIATHRFGDYPHMVLDQVDGRTFWYTAEYGGDGNNNSSTRIFSFQIEKNEHDLEVTSVSGPTASPAPGNMETVSTKVINNGNNTASGFDLELSVNNQVIETFTVSDVLAIDGSFDHTFSTPVDLSQLGDYAIQVKVIYGQDLIAGNNSKTLNINNRASVNGSIAFDSNDIACSGNHFLSIDLKNEGTENLTSADILFSIGGNVVHTENWTGALATDAKETLTVMLQGLAEGANNISVSLDNVNGGTDEVMANNAINKTVTVNSALEEVSFSMLTDLFPDQLSWQISRAGSIDALYSGGSYKPGNQTQIDQLFCLDPDACYKFIIIDSGGDGICCQHRTGSYTLTGPNSEVIFSGNGEFEGSEVVEFCLGNACNLSVDVQAVDVFGSQQGSILVTATGSTNYMYSIDGGVTYQSNPLFDELTAGTYDISVLSQNNCNYNGQVTINLNCQLAIEVNSTTTGQGEGTIEISASGGRDYEYSIDGGQTFSTFNTFTNVATGTYDVVVRSNSGGCTTQETVAVDFVLGTSTIEDKLIVSPNPTNGLFNISLNGYKHVEGFLIVHILDLNGRVIQQRKLSRYDDSFQGSFSLYAYPDGVYFLRIPDPKKGKLVRIVKN